MQTFDILQDLWNRLDLPASALDHVSLTGSDPVLPSSFAVGAAAQTSIAAAALAACEVARVRGAARQLVSVDMLEAAQECTGWFSLDGRSPPSFDALSGLYQCADGWVRLHANFKHHRQGALTLVGLDPDTADRSLVEQAVRKWKGVDLETAAADHGLVLTALRTFEEWDVTPQGHAIATQPLFTIERIGDADPLPLRPASHVAGLDAPLHDVRVLDLTRILAGPVGGRTLAAYGADVMLINAPYLPNIEAIADTSRGKMSAHVDLRSREGADVFRHLLQDAHVMVQGYRPGGLAALGFGPSHVADIRPGIVYITLSAYGREGPWAARRGFDSLVQTAMGFNHAEAQAAGQLKPRAFPMQILDEATGFLIAACAAAALCRQQTEGGSWHVDLSLAQTGQWLRSLGRITHGFDVPPADVSTLLETSQSGFGKLVSIRHSAKLSRTPVRWPHLSMPPGSHQAAWPVR